MPRRKCTGRAERCASRVVGLFAQTRIASCRLPWLRALVGWHLRVKVRSLGLKMLYLEGDDSTYVGQSVVLIQYSLFQFGRCSAVDHLKKIEIEYLMNNG